MSDTTPAQRAAPALLSLAAVVAASPLSAQDRFADPRPAHELLADQPWRTSPALGDVDEDGIADLVLGGFEGFALRRGLSGPPAPRFAVPEPLRDAQGRPLLVGTSCEFRGRPRLVDLDGDGHLDLAALDTPDLWLGAPELRPGDRPRVSWFRGDGEGGFGPSTPLTDRDGRLLEPSRETIGMELADFDGDGHPDLLLTDHQSAHLHRGSGQPARFAAQADRFPLPGTSPQGVDWDADGDLDLLLIQGRHLVVHVDPFVPAQTRPQLTRLLELPASADQPRLLAADGDGDGRIDLLTCFDVTVERPGDGLPLDTIAEQRQAAAQQVLDTIRARLAELNQSRPPLRDPEAMAARHALRAELEAWAAAPRAVLAGLEARQQASRPGQQTRPRAWFHRRLPAGS